MSGISIWFLKIAYFILAALIDFVPGKFKSFPFAFLMMQLSQESRFLNLDIDIQFLKNKPRGRASFVTSSVAGTNVALNKDTFQIDRPDNSYKAVDGNTNVDYNANSCTHTEGRFM